VFPNYGRRKNEPVFAPPSPDLEYYASGCRRTLADPNKARWHDKERIPARRHRERAARQRGLGPTDMSAGGSSSDEPPRASPPGDDDIPF